MTNQARLSQLARNTGNMTLQAPVEVAERLTDELRDIVLTIRLMPIGATFSRFKRLVRDLSGELHKQIELATEGAETELDKTVIDRLGDPLVHLIRNCIDHGIESPDERSRSGKPATGTITLKAAHQGANVVISVIDDGAGLNTTAILAKANETRPARPPMPSSPTSEIFASDLPAWLLHCREGHRCLGAWRGHGRGQARSQFSARLHRRAQRGRPRNPH